MADLQIPHVVIDGTVDDFDQLAPLIVDEFVIVLGVAVVNLLESTLAIVPKLSAIRSEPSELAVEKFEDRIEYARLRRRRDVVRPNIAFPVKDIGQWIRRDFWRSSRSFVFVENNPSSSGVP